MPRTASNTASKFTDARTRLANRALASLVILSATIATSICSILAQEPPQEDGGTGTHCGYSPRTWPDTQKPAGKKNRRVHAADSGLKATHRLPDTQKAASNSTAQPTASAPKANPPWRKPPTAASKNSPTAEELGKRVFQRAGCFSCHPGGENSIAPSKILKGAEFQSQFKSDLVLERTIRAGKAEAGMPEFPRQVISDSEMKNLIVYIRSLSQPPKPGK